jgi:xylulose-5-phosphate/fructose-6-phosphate phosphoketolase
VTVSVPLTAPTRSSPLPQWGDMDARNGVPDHAVLAYWRALNYLSAAQLYLTDNPRLARALTPDDVKETPRGHWGVCPPVNWMLAHLGPVTAHRPPGSELIVVHGAGHAGPSALANAYLNGTLDLSGGGPGWGMSELHCLIRDFPSTARYGSEITPLIPDVRHTGGQLGPALAVAQGMVLDAPQRLVVVLVGDGELETGMTAAAWLGRRALVGSGTHGAVLPVVLANGLRMGGPSLLSGMTRRETGSYFTGLGYTPVFHDGLHVAGFRAALEDVLRQLRPLGAMGRQPMLVLTMPKGHTGPARVAGRQIAGTHAVHKTPLNDPRRRANEFAALTAWLGSYQPTDLLTAQGSPCDLIRQAMPGPPHVTAPSRRPVGLRVRGYGRRQVGTVIRKKAAGGSFRLFSPDELASNRLLPTPNGPTPPWVVEVLSEELCHGWLQGYTETGRDALLVSYEAFAPINASLLIQHLKHRRLHYASGRRSLPSVNYLTTSLGWHNTYTHQNPGLAAAMLEIEDDSVHIYTPADATRAALVLDRMLSGTDAVNLLITDKHPGPQFPSDPIGDELTVGAAIWPQLSCRGRPNLVLASAGDVPAREMTAAAKHIRTTCPDLKIRYVHINDLAVLGPAAARPSALADEQFSRLFGSDVPVLMAVPTTPGAVRGLLAARKDADRFHVVGYRDPGRPLASDELLTHCEMSADALTARVTFLVKEAVE